MYKRKVKQKKPNSSIKDYRNNLYKKTETVSFWQKIFAQSNNTARDSKKNYRSTNSYRKSSKPKFQFERKNTQKKENYRSNKQAKEESNFKNTFFNFSLYIMHRLSAFIDYLDAKFNRDLIIKLGFSFAFLIIVFRLAFIQVEAVPEVLGIKTEPQASAGGHDIVLLAERGQLNISDLKTGSSIPITNTEYHYDVWVDPLTLKEQVEKEMITLDEASKNVSASLNLPYPEIKQKLEEEISKEEPLRYVIIKKEVTPEQKESLQNLRKLNNNPESRNFGKNYAAWIDISTKEKRSYPEGSLMAATIGYVQDSPVTPEEAMKIPGCKEMVENDRMRDIDVTQYKVGRYGLEEKFCSELAGQNGEFAGIDGNSELDKQDGADIYLTIDRNLQMKTEEILEQAVRRNSNESGGPEHGAIMIMNLETGKILSLASYPYFDPNNYSKEFAKNPKSFLNAAAINYEVGSVMKPLTVMSSLNEYYSGRVDENGRRVGTPPDWTTQTYDKEGKIYREIDGKEFHITNANGATFQEFGRVGLKQILRDSINTGIADIVPTIGNLKYKEYLEEKYLFNKSARADLPGAGLGNTASFEDIYCPLCYANLAYGQGFSINMFQLARAYSIIGNEGKMVEPRIIDKIIYPDGTIDEGDLENGILKYPKPVQVVEPEAAQNVVNYMTQSVEEGYKAKVPTKAKLDHYLVGGKSGTAQVNRAYQKTDASGNPVFDENGNPVMIPCDYLCNTKRGIYDHTYVGLGPSRDPKYLIILKLSQPNPGEVQNYADASLAQHYHDLMKYTLEYFEVERDR
jgi:cell division protein FtsI/penicillin-binding protein 2